MPPEDLESMCRFSQLSLIQQQHAESLGPTLGVTRSVLVVTTGVVTLSPDVCPDDIVSHPLCLSLFPTVAPCLPSVCPCPAQCVPVTPLSVPVLPVSRCPHLSYVSLYSSVCPCPPPLAGPKSPKSWGPQSLFMSLRMFPWLLLVLSICIHPGTGRDTPQHPVTPNNIR